uniref:Reverse transcriptase Ty1/copia-type domain-containing protein n=1 Tax=Physcomitrium patens TaxID=3218 RepID=A0A7I3YYH9_PHYPA
MISKKQVMIAQPSTEAKYIAIATSLKELMWLQTLF